jgi:hypothetical protein
VVPPNTVIFSPGEPERSFRDDKDIVGGESHETYIEKQDIF